jgi:hypothetical protein
MASTGSSTNGRIDSSKYCLENFKGEVIAAACATTSASQWWWYDTVAYEQFVYNLSPIKKELPFLWSYAGNGDHLYLKTLEPASYQDEWVFPRYK